MYQRFKTNKHHSIARAHTHTHMHTHTHTHTCVILGIKIKNPRFQVLAAASMKMTVFCDVTLCFLVEIDHGFLITLILEAVRTSETSVNSYETTRRNNLEGSHFQTYACLFAFCQNIDAASFIFQNVVKYRSCF
jgi:hypothetical protein